MPKAVERTKRHKNTQKFLLLSFSCLFAPFCGLKLSDLSFHYSPESKGIEIRNRSAVKTNAIAWWILYNRFAREGSLGGWFVKCRYRFSGVILRNGLRFEYRSSNRSPDGINWEFRHGLARIKISQPASLCVHSIRRGVHLWHPRTANHLQTTNQRLAKPKLLTITTSDNAIAY